MSDSTPLATGEWPALDLGVLSAPIDALGSPAFGQQVLRSLQARLPLCQTVASRIDPGDEMTILWHQSWLDERQLKRMADNYLRTFQLHDPCRPLVKRLRTQAAETMAPTVSHHLTADDIRLREWRTANYERHGIIERFTTLTVVPEREVYALTFFRHTEQGLMSAEELRWLAGISTVLVRMTAKNDRMIRNRAASARNPDELAVMLRRLAPLLTVREESVVARIAAGLTYEEVATQLGIKATSVKTYRDRAFAKLGVDSRPALFALLVAERLPA